MIIISVVIVPIIISAAVIVVISAIVILVIFTVSAELTGIVFVKIILVFIGVADDVQLITSDDHRIRIALRRYRHKITVRIHQGTLHILNQLVRVPVSSLAVLLRTF